MDSGFKELNNAQENVVNTNPLAQLSNDIDHSLDETQSQVNFVIDGIDSKTSNKKITKSKT